MVSWSIIYNMPPNFFSLYMLLWTLWRPSFLYCTSTDTITFGSNVIAIDGKQTLVSAGKKFELGFFSPNANPDRYVGIWYYNLKPLTVVWVANRAKPVPSSITSGVFAITEDGNLEVFDGDENVYWSVHHNSPRHSSKTAKLLDSGNLIFSESSSGKILWESFINSSGDTFLPGMKMDENLVLTSWTSLDDPAAGNFTFQIDESRKDQFLIQNKSTTYWRSGGSGKIISSDPVPPAVANLLLNKSNTLKPADFYKNLTIPSAVHNTRLVMGYDGDLQYWSLDVNKTYWSLIWLQPKDKCSVLNACGNFGICNINNGLMCKCLPGFLPSSVDDWNSGEFSGGCVRKPICKEDDIFLSLNMMKVGQPDSSVSKNFDSEDGCRKECLNNCFCQAYSFIEAENNRGHGNEGTNLCYIWNQALSNLQEEYAAASYSLHARVPLSGMDTDY